MRPEDTPSEPNTTTTPTSPDVVSTNQESVTVDKPVVDADNEADTRPDASPSAETSSVDDPEPTPTTPVPTPPSASSEVVAGGASSKKPLLIGVAAAVIAVLAGGYAAYALWWNAPTKVVDDALASVVMAKNGTANGVMTIASEGSPSFNFAFDSKTIDQKSETTLNASTKVEGKDYKLNAALVTDKDSYYVKVNDLKKTLTSIYGDSQVVSLFDPIVSKIDGKWVVITPDDVKRLSGSDTASNKEMTCVQNVLQGIKSNKNQQNELADAYQKNRFIVVKESKGVESIDGVQSNHYVLNVDEAKAKSFGTALKKTSVFKAVDDCVAEDLAKSTDDAENKTTSGSTPTVELWVDMWSHKPTKLKITSDSKESTKFTFESKFKFDTKVDIATPKADTTVKDIETEINNLQQQFTVPASEV